VAGHQRSFKPSHRAASRSTSSSGPIPLNDLARDAAMRALARQARAYPEMAPDALDFQLRAQSEPAVMTPLDSAFAHAIYDAAVRHWLTLAFLLHREIRQGFDALEPRVRAALLGGAAQLVFLDRVPAHGAINHAVEWAKQVVRPGAGGLVNAVLRRIATLRAEAAVETGVWDDSTVAIPLSDGRVLRHPSLALPDDDLDRLAIATSHPRELLVRWSSRWSADAVRALALHSMIDPPVIVNVEHADAVGVGALSPHSDPNHRLVEPGGEPLANILASGQRIWVQDPSSAGAIRSISDLRPRLIVDLCAGQGTKTRQLAAAFPEAQILATDIDADRFSRLQLVFAGSTQVQVAAFQRVRELALMNADLVLLDVPCSNTGVLPRRVEARYRFNAKTTASITEAQRQLIADSIPLLNTAPGSKPAILYATCSIEPEENESQAAWARQWHRFGLARERFVLPAGGPGEPPFNYHDGAYSILLTRG
jgi:16S rRNA (cytosine967-C5)-methyltransferase